MTIQLYTGFGSGNSYKVELLLYLLSVPFDPIQISIPKGEHRNEEFLALTPFGQIPVLVDNGNVFTDSHAILCYLARAYGGSNADAWLPTEPADLAHVMRWLSFSANEVQNGPTMARAAKLLGWPIDYDNSVAKSYRLLGVMDHHLQQRRWLATGNVTVADIACYPYLLLASEGGIEIEPFSAVCAWMERLESVPNFWPMPRIPNLPHVPISPHKNYLENT